MHDSDCEEDASNTKSIAPPRPRGNGVVGEGMSSQYRRFAFVASLERHSSGVYVRISMRLATCQAGVDGHDTLGIQVRNDP